MLLPLYSIKILSPSAELEHFGAACTGFAIRPLKEENPPSRPPFLRLSALRESQCPDHQMDPPALGVRAELREIRRFSACTKH